MKNNFKNSLTRKKLAKAFLNECKAMFLYSLFSGIASKEKNEQVSRMFLEIMENEKEHAEILFKLMLKNDHIQNSSDDSLDLEKALKLSLLNELDESDNIYPEYRNIANDEGFFDIADIFNKIGKVEQSHYAKFKDIFSDLQEGLLFSSENESVWVCLKCGNIEYGERPPEICPLCSHEYSYYKKEM